MFTNLFNLAIGVGLAAIGVGMSYEACKGLVQEARDPNAVKAQELREEINALEHDNLDLQTGLAKAQAELASIEGARIQPVPSDPGTQTTVQS